MRLEEKIEAAINDIIIEEEMENEVDYKLDLQEINRLIEELAAEIKRGKPYSWMADPDRAYEEKRERERGSN